MKINRITNSEKLVSIASLVQGIDTTGLTTIEDVALGKTKFFEARGIKTQEQRDRLLGAHCLDRMESLDNLSFGDAYEGDFVSVRAEYGLKTDRFKDQIVLDLGAGRSAEGLVLAHKVGARAYIGVEPYFADALYQNVARKLSQSPEIRITASLTDDDMLTFLKRLPNSSVSAFMYGIDKYLIVKDEHQRGQTAIEIARVLHPNGAYVCDDMSIKLADVHGKILPAIKEEVLGIDKMFTKGQDTKL